MSDTAELKAAQERETARDIAIYIREASLTTATDTVLGLRFGKESRAVVQSETVSEIVNDLRAFLVGARYSRQLPTSWDEHLTELANKLTETLK